MSRANGLFKIAPTWKPLIYLDRETGQWTVRVARMMKIGPVTAGFQRQAMAAEKWCFDQNFIEGRL